MRWSSSLPKWAGAATTAKPSLLAAAAAHGATCSTGRHPCQEALSARAQSGEIIGKGWSIESANQINIS